MGDADEDGVGPDENVITGVGDCPDEDGIDSRAVFVYEGAKVCGDGEGVIGDVPGAGGDPIGTSLMHIQGNGGRLKKLGWRG